MIKTFIGNWVIFGISLDFIVKFVPNHRVCRTLKKKVNFVFYYIVSMLFSQLFLNIRSDCPAHLHTFWNYGDELTVANGVILKGMCILIPKSLQADVLQQLHYTHQGAEKCKLRAMGSVFWVNINCLFEN